MAAGPVQEHEYRGTEPDRAADRSLLWRLRQPFVPAIKSGWRRFATATATRRVLPDYLIIGGKRTGSTTLARSLVAADDVMAMVPRRADIKGTYYFDVHHHRGLDWYRSHFPTERAMARQRTKLSRPVVVGEASPYYLHHPHAPARAAAVVPDALIVCVVRDPLDRARSHYEERRRQGLEPLPSFAEALAAEPDRLHSEWSKMMDQPDYVSLAHLNHGYLAQSKYSPALRRWIAEFGSDRVLIVRSETLFDDTVSTVSTVRRFLGLKGRSPIQAMHFNRLSRPGSLIPQTVRAHRVEFEQDQIELAEIIARSAADAGADDPGDD